MKQYESCWHIDVSSGARELESGVVPQYLTTRSGFPVTTHSLFFKKPLKFGLPPFVGLTCIVAFMHFVATLDNKGVFPYPPDRYNVFGLLLFVHHIINIVNTTNII